MEPDHFADSTAANFSPNPKDRHDAIRRRAEEIYIRNGRIPGRDAENWRLAEQEIEREATARTPRRTAVVVDVEGVRYVGEYQPGTADGYRPGELEPGAQVPVRFEGDRMYVRRPNGTELETVVVEKAG